MQIKTKVSKVVLGFALTLLSASCVPFLAAPAAGIIKTTNGGTDWQAINTLKDQSGDLGGVSVSVLAFDPTNADRVFMSSYTGGMFRSEDSGESWERILSRIQVYDFAISPDNSDVLYASGIFDNNGRALVTKDGGKSWVEIYKEASTENAVRAIAVNPANPQEVVIGMSSGNIIKSIDGGTNWKLMNNFEDRVNRIRFQNGNLYVLLRTKGLFVSSDVGQTFAPSLTASIGGSSSSVAGSFSGFSIGSFSQFAVASDSNIIYVTTESGLFKTTSGGTQWQRVAVPVKNDEVAFRAVAIAPSNDSIVYTAAGTTVYKSDDSAQTFQTQGVVGTGFVNFILVHPTFSQIAYAGIFAD